MKEGYKNIFRILAIMLLDIVCMIACGGAAMLARFEFSFQAVPDELVMRLFGFIALQCAVTIVVFMVRKMYHYVWRSVSVYDVADMIISVMLTFMITYVLSHIVGYRIPNSVAFIELICVMMTLVGMRCFLRFYEVAVRVIGHMQTSGKRIMIIGAGEAGRVLLHEIRFSNRTAGKVYCIIDDNHSKWGKKMDGVIIAGGRDVIQEQVRKKKISEIIFAIPSATAAEKQDILRICQNTGCKVRALPGLYQMVNGEVSLADAKAVQVEDLLGRDPIRLNAGVLNNFMRDKVVLVTGGGGSIGSELCRQIVEYRPKQLVIVDIYENNAYDIQQEIVAKYPGMNLKVEIASIRDKDRIYELFAEYRPHIVFHAAAHKHVPLMEFCPQEAIKNNVFGTYNVVTAAEEYGVERFVMISTDKAVNPTNFMGATKRFCEMILQSRTNNKTEFCAVRFGNVLGSNGSVVPLFKRQIEAGGPITLTDKRIIRYFMTITEASQLVLEAGAMAKPGQIFVLDMGEPVKILTLAENLIRMSGLEPYKDIEIREVGLRPGEKLFEELLTADAGLSKTANEKIFVEQQETVSDEYITQCLEHLGNLLETNADKDEIIEVMRGMVPTYVEPTTVNERV